MTDEKVKAAIEEIISVCRKHGVSIAHEDFHGGFLIEEPDENNYAWLRVATNETNREKR
jgi:hypothetical protein